MMTKYLLEPFEDEIHPRLRFAHRGLVAMANNGTKNSNDSQFIFTLGMCHYVIRSAPKKQFMRTHVTQIVRMNSMGNTHYLVDVWEIQCIVRTYHI